MANTDPAHAPETAVAPAIVINPERRRCRPTLEGTRITVEEVMSKLASD
jgi:uncharacterized protein (DUF433 family)